MEVPRAYASGLEAAQDKDVDVIHICTPNSLHMEVAKAALEAGKHVVCEKPLATSLHDARELTELAKRKGLIGTVPFINRYHPMVREAQARVQSDETGKLVPDPGLVFAGLADASRRHQLAGRRRSRWRLACVRGHRLASVRSVGMDYRRTLHVVDRNARYADRTALRGRQPSCVPSQRRGQGHEARVDRRRRVPDPAHRSRHARLADHQPGFRRPQESPVVRIGWRAAKRRCSIWKAPSNCGSVAAKA